MSKKTYKTLIFILFFSLALPIVAKGLEVYYPPINEASPGGGPAGWIEYIFYLMLGVTSIAAVGTLIYAGIVWMTSGATEKIKEAKEMIWGAVIGIVIIAGSVLLLNTINPDLTNLRTPSINKYTEDPGVLGTSCSSNSDCGSNHYECVSGVCEIVGENGNYQWIQSGPGQQACSRLGTGWRGVPDNLCEARGLEPLGAEYPSVDMCCFKPEDN